MDKFTETYLKIIAEANEMNQVGSLDNEQEKDPSKANSFFISFIYQDAWPYTGEEPDKAWDELSEKNLDEMKLEDGSILTFNGRLPEGTDFDEFFKQFNGECVDGPATFTEGGEYEYKYEFDGISKDDLYKLMTTVIQPKYDGVTVFERLSNHRIDANEIQKRAKQSPEDMVKALMDVYKNNGDNAIQDYILDFAFEII